MDRKAATLNSVTPAGTTVLRTWIKPEATAAEVAKATLGAGGPNKNSADIQNCAS